MRKKIESCLSVFVELAEGVEGSPIATTSTDAKTGNRLETVEPGMIEYLKPGESIKTAAPASAGGYAEYLTKQERKLATGMGVMYEQMTGDLSLVNYSSIQAGRIEFKVDLEEYRDTTHIPGMQRIWNKFIDAAFLAQRIPEVNYGCRWTPKPWQSVDAVKDAEANLIEVRTGRKTWGASVIEQGGEPAKQLARIAADNAAFDAAGVILDIDPRNVDRNRGAFQIKQTEAITDGSKKEA
jgi:capsid protein